LDGGGDDFYSDWVAYALNHREKSVFARFKRALTRAFIDPQHLHHEVERRKGSAMLKISGT
jgi:hypothetical protein